MKAAELSQSKAYGSAPSSWGSIASVCLALAAGGLLRLWMVLKFFEVNGDSQLYGGIAKNLLLYGRYALGNGSGALYSSLIRLPGYPFFLAACFRLFGMENYFAVSCVQIAMELAGCLLVAGFVYRISPAGLRGTSAKAALWLGALCPFTAIYAAEPLAEAPTLFAIALALWAVARYRDERDWASALAFTFGMTFAALLRPDGVLAGAALGAPMIFTRSCEHTSANEKAAAAHRRKLYVCLLIALAPFAAWTARNWMVFHVWEPLAPRYATEPGEDTWPGWQRWVKTWSLDFTTTYTIYWNMPGGELSLADLPARAFDSAGQRQQTAQLFADYESSGEQMSPGLDARFARLAAERIGSHPLRYYVWLPLGRMADMWLRPRVENLPIDLDWWNYRRHHSETEFSWLYAGLNALYLLLGVAGLVARPRFWRWMLVYFVLRSALLCTIESPEARYALECFPMLFALGGVAVGRWRVNFRGNAQEAPETRRMVS